MRNAFVLDWRGDLVVGGLTSFWHRLEQRQMRQQIPFGDDNKNSNDNRDNEAQQKRMA
jgi:hypothetical protein